MAHLQIIRAFRPGRRSLHTGCILLLLNTAWLLGCGDADSSSAVRCIKPVWNFGTVDPVTVPQVEHSFVIENVSDQPVQISKIQTSCGCMVVNKVADLIRPHSTVEVKITTKVAGKPGPFQKTAFVQLGTSPPTAVQLVVEGDLLATADLFSIPEIVDFGVVTDQKTKSRTLRLARYDGSPLEIRAIETGLTGVEARISESSDIAAVQVVLTADGSLLDPGDLKSTITVYGIGSSEPLIEIPLRARSPGNTEGLRKTVFVPRLDVGMYAVISLTDDAEVSESIRAISYDGTR